MTATRSKKVKWKPILAVQVYRMVKMGLTDVEIAKGLGVTAKTMWVWRQEHPEFAEAVEMARKEMEESETFPDWVYSRLSPELKEVWNQIKKWEREKNGVTRIELMLQDHGKQVRQQLFLHALCTHRFSPSLAMQKVNITKRELDHWIEYDPGFAALVEEIQWHKGNFFEESLVRLVQEKNVAAVIFANKTFNQGRGYVSKTQHDVNVSGQIAHGVLDLSTLIPFLKEDTKLELLEAIRMLEKQDAPKPLGHKEVLEHQIAESVSGN